MYHVLFFRLSVLSVMFILLLFYADLLFQFVQTALCSRFITFVHSQRFAGVLATTVTADIVASSITTMEFFDRLHTEGKKLNYISRG